MAFGVRFYINPNLPACRFDHGCHPIRFSFEAVVIGQVLRRNVANAVFAVIDGGKAYFGTRPGAETRHQQIADT